MGLAYSVMCECAMKRLEHENFERRQRVLLEKSGVSRAFRDCTFDLYEAWNESAAGAKAYAMTYVQDFERIENLRRNSIAILGNVGSGKTMLGICILNALMERGINVLYAPYKDMVQALKAKVTDNSYEAECEKYTRPRVLFLDDLYKGATDKDPKYVYDVINARYLANKPIIITSELDAESILGMDEAVGSRIIEMCRDFITELRGEGLNYRLRGLV